MDPGQADPTKDTPSEAPAAAPVTQPNIRARGERAVAFAVALAGIAVALWVLAVPVRIDGTFAVLPRGTTVADLIRSARLAQKPGDLVSVSGRMLRRGAGAAPIVRVGGVATGSAAVLGPGSWITSMRGPDAVEATTTTKVPGTQSLRFLGHGPVASVEDSGIPGVIELTIGEVSREEVSRRELSRGTAMTVRLEPSWPGRKEVALTFDDGPWPGSTDAVLRQLTAAGVKATFFMIGRQVKARPTVVARVLAAGMEIGNHSYSHKLLRRASHKRITSEIADGAKAIRRVTGSYPVWYRPAGGSKNAFVFAEARRLDQRVVLWTVDPNDWKRPGAGKIARRVLDHVRPGSVILMHDGGGDRSQTVVALGLVIKGLKARGYSMVTLSRLYRLPGARP